MAKKDELQNLIAKQVSADFSDMEKMGQQAAKHFLHSFDAAFKDYMSELKQQLSGLSKGSDAYDEMLKRMKLQNEHYLDGRINDEKLANEKSKKLQDIHYQNMNDEINKMGIFEQKAVREAMMRRLEGDKKENESRQRQLKSKLDFWKLESENAENSEEEREAALREVDKLKNELKSLEYSLGEINDRYKTQAELIKAPTKAVESYMQKTVDGSKQLAKSKEEEAEKREEAAKAAEYDLELAEEAVKATKEKIKAAEALGDNEEVDRLEEELELQNEILEVRRSAAKEASDASKEALQSSIEAKKHALEMEKTQRRESRGNTALTIDGRKIGPSISGDPKAQITNTIEDRTKDAKESLEISKQELELQRKENEEKKKAREEERRKKQEEGTWTDADEAAAAVAEREDEEALAEKEKKVQSDSAIVKALEKLGDKMEEAFTSIDTAMKTYYQYTAKIDARLQGSDNTFEDIVDLINSNLSLSPLVKTKEVMEKLNEAVEHGIVYNVEQRAFLETISEKIANTFDAFDANLLRLIRLQQADSTAARLGMEATLTQMLNEMFEDNSYLSDSGAKDAVAGAIIDAQSQMSRDQALEFEFIVQKWLGSLGSLGMGNETLTQIAEGINYLGTGNVEALSSNESLQTLIAMSASEAGLSLADMLVNGLTSDDTNKLLKSMVEYLKDIAEGDNQVVKSAYGGIFNMSQSDMRAINNLSTSDINSIASQSLSYNQAMAETQSQLFLAATRTPISEMMDNIFDNVMTNIGTELAEDPALMAAWKINDFIEGQTGGINVPFVNAMGFGLDLNANVNQLIKLGLAGYSMLGMTGNMLSSLGNGGGLNLNGWDAEAYTSRGSGFTGITRGASSTTSQSVYVGSSSGDDAQKSTLSKATEDAKESGEITNAGMEQEHTLDDFYKALLEDKEYVRAEVSLPKDSSIDVRLAAIQQGVFEDETITAQLTDEQFRGFINAIGAGVFFSKYGTLPENSINPLSDFNSIYNSTLSSLTLLNPTELAIDGSHASGLDTVPFDGYIAELHKNEAILNANDASVWRNQQSNSTAQQIYNMGVEISSSIDKSSEMLDSSLSSILSEGVTANYNLGSDGDLLEALSSKGSIAPLLSSDGYINSTLNSIVEENSAIKEALGMDGAISYVLSEDGALSQALKGSGGLNEVLVQSFAAETTVLAETNSKLEAIHKDFFDGGSAKQVNVAISEQDGGLNRLYDALSEIRLALVGSSNKETILSAIDNNNSKVNGILNALGATTEDGKGSISIAALIEKLNELANDPVGFKTHVANPLSGASGEALDTMAYVLTLGGAL